MGCGISKIDLAEESDRPKRSHKRSNDNNHVHANRNNNNNNNNTIKVDDADDFANDDHLMHGARKSVSSLPVIAVNNNNKGNGSNGKGVIEETNYFERDKGNCKESSFSDREDAIGFSASPSFREYCVDSGYSNDGNGGKEEKSSQGERASNVEKVHSVEQERPFLSESVHGSRSPEGHMKSTRKGFRSAMQKPAGWIGKSKK